MAIEEFVMYGSCTLCISSSIEEDLNKIIRVTNVRTGASWTGRMEEDPNQETGDGKIKCYFNVPNRGKYRINVHNTQGVGGIVLYTTVGFGEFKEIPVDVEQFTWEGIKDLVNAERMVKLMALNGSTIDLVLQDDYATTITYAINYDTYGLGEVDFIPTSAIPAQAITRSATMCSPRTMFDTKTNVGGWPQSVLCQMLNDEFYNLLPNEVRNNITPKKVPATTGGKNGTAGISVTSNIWVPTEYEVFGTSGGKTSVGYNSYTTYSTATGEPYSVFADKPSRIRKYQTTTAKEVAYAWWTATPAYANATNFVAVTSAGARKADAAGNAKYAVLPCFRFGKD